MLRALPHMSRRSQLVPPQSAAVRPVTPRMRSAWGFRNITKHLLMATLAAENILAQSCALMRRPALPCSFCLQTHVGPLHGPHPAAKLVMAPHIAWIVRYDTSLQGQAIFDGPVKTAICHIAVNTAGFAPSLTSVCNYKRHLDQAAIILLRRLYFLPQHLSRGACTENGKGPQRNWSPLPSFTRAQLLHS